MSYNSDMHIYLSMYSMDMKKTARGKVLKSGPLETLFSGNATAKIMDFMISSQEWDYSESDIARNSDVSIRTVQREISKLIESKLVKHVRTVGNAKMYQLDKSHKTGEQMEKLAFSLAQLRIQKSIHKMTPAEPLNEIKGKEKFKVEEITPIEEEPLSSVPESALSSELEDLVAE